MRMDAYGTADQWQGKVCRNARRGTPNILKGLYRLYTAHYLYFFDRFRVQVKSQYWTKYFVFSNCFDVPGPLPWFEGGSRPQGLQDDICGQHALTKVPSIES